MDNKAVVPKKGIVKKLKHDKVILTIIKLESGHLKIECDKTINGIYGRIPKDARK